MIAVLQILPLLTLKIDMSILRDSEGEALVENIRKTILQPVCPADDRLSPHSVKNTLASLAPRNSICGIFADEQQHCAQEALECILSVLEDIVGVDLSEVSQQSTTYTCVTDTCSNSRIEK